MADPCGVGGCGRGGICVGHFEEFNGDTLPSKTERREEYKEKEGSTKAGDL